MSGHINFFADAFPTNSSKPSRFSDKSTGSDDQKDAFLDVLSESDQANDETDNEFLPVSAAQATNDELAKKDAEGIALSAQQHANTNSIEADHTLTPLQPGQAPRPSLVPAPATPPFQQSAEAVLTPEVSASEIELVSGRASEEPQTLGITPSLNSTKSVPSEHNSITPSQFGSAPRPSYVQIPANTPFPQNAATVFTSQSDLPVSAAEAPTASLEPELATLEQTLALPQSGNASRPSIMQIPADPPFPQSIAAAHPDSESATARLLATGENETEVPASGDLPTVAEADIAGEFTNAQIDIESHRETGPAPEGQHIQSIASEDAELTYSVARSTASGTSLDTTANVLDTPLAPSQPGPALRPSNVHIPAASPAPQSAAAVLTAQVADIPNILSEALSADDGTKQIRIQLDPPELGRVSIEFKFDGNVLQNVVVTGETPEAMRRLRLMHFELVQSLESFGYTGQELDFSQRDDQQREFSPEGFFGADQNLEFSEDPNFLNASEFRRTPIKVTTEGLDLKL